jgi:homoserine kinase type II
MLALANIYLINWEATDYYGNMDLNDYEYLAYLKHNIRLMQWIEEHKDEIEKLKMVS